MSGCRRGRIVRARSRPDAALAAPHRPPRLGPLAALCLLLGSASMGCWEQWSESWFPQMKWQKAIQPFERVTLGDRVQGFAPPEGTVPVDGVPAPVVGRLDFEAADQLVNPTSPDDFRSLVRGQQLYQSYCRVCHGDRGMGDGPVSAAGTKQGPFVGVFPLATAAARSDGYIYNVIRIGNGGQPGYRMPSYKHIPSEDRWHIVNYVRYLQRGGQP